MTRNTKTFKQVIEFIQALYRTKGFIALHEPRFIGNEKKYLMDCIDSTFVSSVGKYVDRFEEIIKTYANTAYAVATVNGTAALHIALKLSGVKHDDEVITQPLTFVATCNAINYCGARPVFVDVDRDTLGMSPGKLEGFLNSYSVMKEDGHCYNNVTGKVIKACVPVHIFGFPGRIEEIRRICERFNIALIEDAAESLGSKYRERYAGTFGKLGVYSFNGNKTITCGGGGVIITDDEGYGKHAKHVTTTAKIPHAYEYIHDEVGYNYRLPNINAALACAQMENLDIFIEKKRELAEKYRAFFGNLGITFLTEIEGCRANYWLNAMVLDNRNERDAFLGYSNENRVMTRPIWRLMNKLPMYSDCLSVDLENAQWLEDRVVNIPSSVIL